MNIKKIGFWGLLALAFAPRLTGDLAAAQKMVRIPVNMLIVSYFVPVFLLFSSLWWLGLILLAAVIYATPKVVRKLRSMLND